jgi:hypothetical protein
MRQPKGMAMMTQMPPRRIVLSALFVSLPLLIWARRSAAQGSLLDTGKALLNQNLPGNASGAGSGALGGSLSQGEIGSGLKDALKVASQRVVGRVGKLDGFNGDSAIRIPLPGPLAKIEGPLKSIGASAMLDDLQLKMNRAAEQAAPKALGIFTDAASKMSIDDARGILNGPKDAATQYFKRTTSASLTSSFHPIVDSQLSQVGAVSAFKSVQAKSSELPLVGQEVQTFNLTDFTVGKALDGVFHYLGVEEAAIRTNPAARTTDLLKKVFA